MEKNLSKKKVNLFIVGIAKAGTTWLHYLLDAHDEIFMSKRKEHYYFGDVYPKNIEKYEKNFPFEKSYKYFGESTPTYYLSIKIAKQIKEYSPDAKIIVLVRDPIQRLLSLIYFYKQLGNVSENQNLEEIFENFDPELIDTSHYENTIPAFEKIIGKKNMKIFSLEKAKRDTQNFWNELQDFLELKSIDLPEIGFKNKNATGSRAFRIFYKLTIRPIAKKYNRLYKILLKSKFLKWSKFHLLNILGKAEKDELPAELNTKLRNKFADTYKYLEEIGFGDIYK